jgi:hypothetical protein
MALIEGYGHQTRTNFDIAISDANRRVISALVTLEFVNDIDERIPAILSKLKAVSDEIGVLYREQYLKWQEAQKAA